MEKVLFAIALMVLSAAAVGQPNDGDVEKIANELAGDRLVQNIDRDEFCRKAAPVEAELRSQGKNARNSLHLRSFFNLFNNIEKCTRLKSA